MNLLPLIINKKTNLIMLLTVIVFASIENQSNPFSFKGFTETAATANPNIYIPDTYTLGYQAVREANGYNSVMPSTGNIKMLVIPVTFTDYPCSALALGCDETRDDITKAFFGTSEETGWESVASYYEKSSYGNLLISGLVTDWFTPTITALQLAGVGTSGVSDSILKNAISWYRTNSGDDGRQFDSDGDGYMDAVYLVYSLPPNPVGNGMPEDSSVFWAFTTYYGGPGSVTRPNVYQYCWSSYQFMYEDGYYDRDEQGRILRDENDEPVFHPWTDLNGRNLIDSHTYIHEVGHMLSLTDYYTYDSDEGDWGAGGALDMMDYNVGDHNPYSKALLNWTKPMVVTGTTTITLEPFQNSGQFLLLASKFNETLIDEYIVLEYYTPTNLNLKDSSFQFAGRYPRVFQESGLKVYHVDSRLGSFVSGGFDRYVTKLGTPSNLGYYGIGNSNSASRSGVAANKLLHLLERSGLNTFKHGGYATNDTLWQEGDSFGYGTFRNFALNNRTLLPYRFRVISMNEQGIELQIVKFQ